MLCDEWLFVLYVTSQLETGAWCFIIYREICLYNKQWFSQCIQYSNLLKILNKRRIEGLFLLHSIIGKDLAVTN
jgi:hypothetical protein